MSASRCAIYTRKSSDEGLEQDFNSLDAQREACAAYVASQKGEGWLELPNRYDDGGYSGGNMERPGLARPARLGDMHPPQRPGPISARPQLRGEFFKERLHPGSLDVLSADAINPGRTLVGPHVIPRPPHHVAAGDLVKQGVEPTLGILLGTAIKHTLESSNAVLDRPTGNDGLIWTHCDGFDRPHFVRSLADDPALIERGTEAGRKWDQEWSCLSRSDVIATVRGCRSGRLRLGMVCTVARSGRRWRRRCRRRGERRRTGRRRSWVSTAS